MAAELDRYDRDAPPGEADVAEVLREINTLRSGKALDRYLAQFRAYCQGRRRRGRPAPVRGQVRPAR